MVGVVQWGQITLEGQYFLNKSLFLEDEKDCSLWQKSP